MWDIWKRAWAKQIEECTTPTTSVTKRRFEDDTSSPAQESKRPRRINNGTNGYPNYCTEEDLKILGAAKENDCGSYFLNLWANSIKVFLTPLWQ
jgi:hypothetical protein